MSDEIKESINHIQSIVDFYKLDDENNYDYSDDVLTSMKTLLDYITNLQQENDYLTNELNTCMIERNKYVSRNERLSQQNFNLIEYRDSLIDENSEELEQLDDYKSRCDKALELLKQDKQSASFNSAEVLAINILQGGKDE